MQAHHGMRPSIGAWAWGHRPTASSLSWLGTYIALPIPNSFSDRILVWAATAPTDRAHGTFYTTVQEFSHAHKQCCWPWGALGFTSLGGQIVLAFFSKFLFGERLRL